MLEQLSDVTLRAKKFAYKRLGCVPGCIALGCADIGVAELESGEKVTITWGRNLDRRQQEWFARETFFRPIHLGADDGSAELIIPTEIAELLLPIVR